MKIMSQLSQTLKRLSSIAKVQLNLSQTASTTPLPNPSGHVLLGILMSILCGAIPLQAAASCTMTPSAPAIKLLTSPGLITLNPNIPIGTVIYSTTLPSTTTITSNVTCTSSFNTLTYSGIGTPTGNIYPTNIPGVGIKFQNAGSTTFWPSTTTITNSTSLNTTPSIGTTISLIKTGNITGGGTISGQVGSVTISPNQNNYQIISIVFSATTIVQVQPTCTVTTPNINVSLGNESINSFPSIGSTSAAVPFNIVLNCANGSSGLSVNVFTTFTDPTNSSNTSNTLPLSASSTASGVKVQLLNGTTLISYGPDSNVVGNTNQILLGTNSNNVYTYSFYARYIRTGTVTPGTANSSATFTMSYQ